MGLGWTEMRKAFTLSMLVVALVSLTTVVAGAQAATRPKAPPISGKTVQGPKASLAKLRGKPVFINVWSSW